MYILRVNTGEGVMHGNGFTVVLTERMLIKDFLNSFIQVDPEKVFIGFVDNEAKTFPPSYWREGGENNNNNLWVDKGS